MSRRFSDTLKSTKENYGSKILIDQCFCAVCCLPFYSKLCCYRPETMIDAWTLDEGSGKIAKDSSLYKNDGPLKSAPTQAGGHFGKALSFDGKTDYIDCGNAESLQIPKSLTVMGWVKPEKALGLDNYWCRFATRGTVSHTGWIIGG